MSKRVIFGVIILAGILCLALFMYFPAHVSDERATSSVIPEPDVNAPYIFISGGSKSFSMAPGDLFFHKIGRKMPYREQFDGIFAFISRGRSASLLAQKGENELKFYGSIKFDNKDLKKLDQGVLPEQWKELKGCVLEPEKDGSFLLFPTAESQPLYMKINGELVLISNGSEDLQLMMEVVAGTIDNIKVERNEEYPNHLNVNDAGLLSQVAALYGMKVKPGNLRLWADWEDTEGKGELEWKISGISEIFQKEVLGKIRPRKWKEDLVLPAPVFFAAGINIPKVSEEVYSDLGLHQLQQDSGISSDLFREAISGPVVLNVSGKSKFLLFSFPGIILQLIERGRTGIELVQLFWSQNWGTFKPSMDPVEGYEAGGVSSLPLSLVGAANEDLAVIGFLEQELLEKKEKPAKVFPLMAKADESVLWIFLDGPGLSRSLEGLISASSFAEKMGSSIAEKAETIKDASRRLQKMGKISFIMKSLEKGLIRWENVELVSLDTKI